MIHERMNVVDAFTGTFYIIYGICIEVYVCYVYWWRDVSTSECILRIQLRTVYEQTLLPNVTTTNFDTDPTSYTSHIASESVCIEKMFITSRTVYGNTTSPSPSSFIHETPH